jgi:hypothetical protein
VQWTQGKIMRFFEISHLSFPFLFLSTLSKRKRKGKDSSPFLKTLIHSLQVPPLPLRGRWGPWYASSSPAYLSFPLINERESAGPHLPIPFRPQKRGERGLIDCRSILAKRRPNGYAIFPLLTRERYRPRRVDVYFNPF